MADKVVKLATAKAPDRDVMAALRRIDEAESRKAAESGELQNRWKEAKEKGIHIDSLKVARKLQRMDEAQRSAWLDNFQRWVDLLELDRQQELPLEGDEATRDALAPGFQQPPEGSFH